MGYTPDSGGDPAVDTSNESERGGVCRWSCQQELMVVSRRATSMAQRELVGELYLRVGVLIRVRSWNVDTSHRCVAHTERADLLLIVFLLHRMYHAR